MASRTPRCAGFICNLCRRQQLSSQPFKALAPQFSRGLATNQRRHPKAPASTRRSPDPVSSIATQFLPHNEVSRARVPTAPPTEPSTLPFTLQSLVEEGAKIKSSSSVPGEVESLEFLERCHEYASITVFGEPEPPQDAEGALQKKDGGATSYLLDLDELPTNTTVDAKTPTNTPEALISNRQNDRATISKLAYDVLRSPNVYITAPMLELYVRINCLLGTPEYLPQIFYLYANKPIPKPHTSPIVYTKPWPRHPKNAIPQHLSEAALEAAIAKKDLPLAISIIDTTVAQPAFRANKIFRRASLPLLGAGLTPLVAWSFAEKVAEWQNTWDLGMAKFIFMSATMAYISTLGIVGFVALTTYNDHFERVVWQPGMNLRDRWVREEERLFFDRVALAWGFKERHRRGEEQGEEWDALREFVGMRSMVLDRSNLLEGME